MSLEILESTTQNTAIDWSTILISFASAIVGALLAGIITHFSNEKIRKRDLIDKEKRESYAVISDYLFSILSNLSDYKMNGYEPLNENIEKENQNILKTVRDLVKGAPSGRYILSFSEKTKSLYYSTIAGLREIEELAVKVESRINETRGLPHPEGAPGMQPRGHRGLWARLDESINQAKDHVQTCQAAVRDERET